jgi:hypothetical protein
LNPFHVDYRFLRAFPELERRSIEDFPFVVISPSLQSGRIGISEVASGQIMEGVAETRQMGPACIVRLAIASVFSAFDGRRSRTGSRPWLWICRSEGSSGMMQGDGWLFSFHHREVLALLLNVLFCLANQDRLSSGGEEPGAE